jgi:hypothetical protein
LKKVVLPKKKCDTLSLFSSPSTILENIQLLTKQANMMIFGFLSMYMLFGSAIHAAAQSATMTPIYSMTLPTTPAMNLSVLQDTATQDITLELIMDANNKYTSLMEIGELLQGKIMTADVKVSGYRTVNGVAMPEQVLLDMPNIGPMMMAAMMNPASDAAGSAALFEEPLMQFGNNVMSTLPSSDDTVFWQAMSTALQRWITNGNGSGARQLLASVAGGLRGI